MSLWTHKKSSVRKNVLLTLHSNNASGCSRNPVKHHINVSWRDIKSSVAGNPENESYTITDDSHSVLWGAETCFWCWIKIKRKQRLLISQFWLFFSQLQGHISQFWENKSDLWHIKTCNCKKNVWIVRKTQLFLSCQLLSKPSNAESWILLSK